MNKIFIPTVISTAVLMLMISHAQANTTTAVVQNNSAKIPAQPAQLATIVVSASGFDQDIKKAAASITVLSQEQINKRVIVM